MIACLALSCGSEDSPSGNSGSGGNAGAGGAPASGGPSTGTSTSSTTSSGDGGAGGKGGGAASNGASGAGGEPSGAGAGGGGGGGATTSGGTGAGGSPPSAWLDPTFGTDGVATAVGFETGDALFAVARQADGKIVLVGTSSSAQETSTQNSGEILVVRLEADGDVDTSFGTNGKVLTPLFLKAEGHAVVVQPDQKIVVLGTAFPTNAGPVEVVVRYLATGALDPDFGGGKGYVIGTHSYGTAVALQPDGKILTAGATGLLDVTRYTANGEVDLTFGTNGSAHGDAGHADAIAVDATGRIVAAGFSGFPSDMAVARFTPAGKLDTTFAGDGTTTIDIAGGNDSARTLAIQDDGKILVGGQGYLSGVPADTAAVVVRLSVDGTLDTSFGGGDGIYARDSVSVIDSVLSMARRSDGKIFVGGYANGSAVGLLSAAGEPETSFGDAGWVGLPSVATDLQSVALDGSGGVLVGGSRVDVSLNDKQDFVVARVTPAGTLDTSFQGTGYVTHNSRASRELGSTFALAPGGAVVGAGSTVKNFTRRGVLARWTSDGTPDATLGGTGSIRLDEIAVVKGIAVQQDGKTLLTGWGVSSFRFLLLRYDTTGKLDPSFATQGIAEHTFDGFNAAFPRAMALDAAGNVVIAGNAGADFALMRFTPDGALDTTFGEDGKVRTPIDKALAAYALVTLPNGKILVAGDTNPGTPTTALARYLSDGTLDATFGTGGILTLPIPILVDRMVRLPSGKILLAGHRNQLGGTSLDFARIDEDGSLDSTFGMQGVVSQSLPLIAPYGQRHAGPGVALEQDGSFYVATAAAQGERVRMLVQRFTEDGALDASFGTAGSIAVPDDDTLGVWHAFEALRQPDGKLVIGGRGFSNAGGTDLAVLRLVP